MNLIFIDNTPINAPQKCYLLKNDDRLPETDLAFFEKLDSSFHKDDFILVGEVVSVNKTTKVVTLKDDNTLSYNHLIVASSNNNSLVTEEFINGIQALIEAMKIRKKIPSSFAHIGVSKKSKKLSKNSSLQDKELQKKEKLSSERLLRYLVLSQDTSFKLNDPSKVVYEVQV